MYECLDVLTILKPGHSGMIGHNRDMCADQVLLQELPGFRNHFKQPFVLNSIQF